MSTNDEGDRNEGNYNPDAFTYQGSERNELAWPEIISIVRSKQFEGILEQFEPTGADCPFCGEKRQIVKGAPRMPKKICADQCLKDNLNHLFHEHPELIDAVAAAFALKEELHNGATIHWGDDDYRNNNLLFWDAQNKKIVYPFTEWDDYGSVPPVFPVGDGYFSPGDWLNEVEHNSMVFPAWPLIKEMKEFAAANPKEKSMIVVINGAEYLVKYNNRMTDEDWDSCILNVAPARMPWGDKDHNGPDWLNVRAGLPEWRRNIVEETNANISRKNAALMGLVAAHAKGPEGNAVVESEIGRHAKGGKRGTRKNKKRGGF
jgi:hypothetical protein